MDQKTLPSPPPSNEMLLPPGFNELLQHNHGITSYPRGEHNFDAAELHSQQASRYPTPIPQPLVGYDAEVYQAGYAGQYKQSNYPAPFSTQTSPYALPEDFRCPIPNLYGTPATAPPSPTDASDFMTTRSGTVIGRAVRPKSGASVRSGRVQKTKKATRAKAPKQVTTLDAPLSQDSKNPHVPVADIKAYVNRSAEERRREVEQGETPGRIKRPMNAFMLYRKAYQDRAKKWCSQNNHQIVSQVCGASWPMEPIEVREQYTEWAKLERENHQKAHPGYKFSPSKPRKEDEKKGGDRTDSDDGSDLEDYEWTPNRSTPGSRSRAKAPSQDPNDDWLPRAGGDRRQIRHQQPYSSLPQPRQAQQAPACVHADGPYASHFQYSNPGKNLPSPYGTQITVPGQYWEQSQQRDPRRQPPYGMVEDVMMRRVQALSPNSGYHGLPNPMFDSFDLGPFEQSIVKPMVPSPGAPNAATAAPTNMENQLGSQHLEPQIDPSLAAHGLPSSTLSHEEQSHWAMDQRYQDWQAITDTSGSADATQDLPALAPFLSYDTADQEQDLSMHVLKAADESWQLHQANN